MKTLDKKQIPQFAALCVLSAGVFGYFVVKIVTPSPAAAGTRRPAGPVTPQAAPTVGPAADKKAGTSQAVALSANGMEVPIPTPGMRDPFVVGYVDPKTLTTPAPPLPAAAPAKAPKAAVPQLASIHEVGPGPGGVPAAPVLPFGLKSFPPPPAAPSPPAPLKPAAPDVPPPTWTVTGVLQNEQGEVAILRSGEARRIVRTGDFVDSAFRVVAVTRSAVTLRHGQTFYHLTLGDAKPAAPPAKTLFAPAARPGAGPKPFSKTEAAAQAKATLPAGPDAGLAQVLRAALLLAQSYLAPAQEEVEVCLAAFHARRALPPRVAMRFLDGSVPASVTEAARTRLNLGRQLYQNGQYSAGRAQWRQVLAMNDLDAAEEAGKMLDRFN